MGPEQEVDAALGLERPQVEVVVELADDVDADHVAERLDDPQIGMRAIDDPAGVAELRTRERERRLGLPDAGGAVEEKRVRVPILERGGQAGASPPAAPECSRTDRRSPRRSGSGRGDQRRQLVRLARAVEHEVPVGLARSELAVGGRGPRVEAVVLALDPVALATHPGHGVVGPDLEQDRADRASAPRRPRG